MKGKIRVNRIDLHYEEQGSGATLIFIHDNLADYRSWQPYLKPLARLYRVITYSRRYNYPNQNRGISSTYSTLADAEDLAALMAVLASGEPVHLIGHAYGACVALLFACEQPALVRSLVVAEPPLLKWLPDLPGGAALYAEHMLNLWQPVRQAFQQGDADTALQVAVDYLAGQGGTLAPIRPEGRQRLVQNLGEWQALALSEDAFPPVDRERVKQLSLPLLSITGQSSPRLWRLISAELERLAPQAQPIAVPQVGHQMWDQDPEACREIVLKFLGDQPSSN